MSKYRNKRLAGKAGLGILILLVALVLAACGESTATPAPTATPVPPTATPAPPTATPVPATTAPATTVASSAATTPAGTASSAGGSAATGPVTLTLPAISGATEIPVDTSLIESLAKQQGLSSAALKFYASDDTTDKLATSADTVITGTGYKFGLPGVDKPLNQGGVVVGFYQKSGAPDILMAVADPSTFTTGFTIPGVSSDVLKSFTDKLNGKKSVLILVAAPDLLSALLGATSGSGTSGSGSAATPATTTGSGASGSSSATPTTTPK